MLTRFGPEAYWGQFQFAYGDKIERSYVCEETKLDNDPATLVGIGISKFSISMSRVIGTGDTWDLHGASPLLGHALSYKLNNGSMGGSEGIRWANGYNAELSFNDVHGDKGPVTMGMSIFENGGLRDNFLCKPTAQVISRVRDR